MAGTFTSIYRREGSLHITGICAAYYSGPAKTCRRKSDGGAIRPERSFFKDTPIGADLESYWAVCCCATTCWSPTYSRFLPEWYEGRVG